VAVGTSVQLMHPSSCNCPVSSMANYTKYLVLAVLMGLRAAGAIVILKVHWSKPDLGKGHALRLPQQPDSSSHIVCSDALICFASKACTLCALYLALMARALRQAACLQTSQSTSYV
jgi:hypothetical protein